MNFGIGDAVKPNFLARFEAEPGSFHGDASPAVNDTTRLLSRSRQILDPRSLNDDFDAWRIDRIAGKSEATGRVA